MNVPVDTATAGSHIAALPMESYSIAQRKMPCYSEHQRRLLKAMWPVVWCVLTSGCVSRRLVVHSDPPGALVMIDGREIGYTPAAIDFTYYATREVSLIKDGYETMTILQETPRPWYQAPGVDFFFDNFSFSNLTDRNVFRYRLKPKTIISDQDLINRANQLRSDALIGP